MGASSADNPVIVRAANDSGPRRAIDIRLIVLHSTEGGTAGTVAAMFSRPSAKASTHFVVDDKTTCRMLPDLVIPWGAPGANFHGLHIEQCGFAKWQTSEWMAHKSELLRAADVLSLWAFRYGIPLRKLTTPQLKAGTLRGVVTHAQCSVAFPPNDGHSDPGAGYPIKFVLDAANDLLMKRIRDYGKKNT